MLSQSRHVNKLRPGNLQGIEFRIVLRGVAGERDAIEANLQAVASRGVPNYFGAQRFGFDGGNVEQGRAMLAREIRVRNPKKKGIYLSAVRWRCASSKASGVRRCPATCSTTRAAPPARSGGAAA